MAFLPRFDFEVDWFATDSAPLPAIALVHGISRATVQGAAPGTLSVPPHALAVVVWVLMVLIYLYVTHAAPLACFGSG